MCALGGSAPAHVCWDSDTSPAGNSTLITAIRMTDSIISVSLNLLCTCSDCSPIRVPIRMAKRVSYGYFRKMNVWYIGILSGRQRAAGGEAIMSGNPANLIKRHARAVSSMYGIIILETFRNKNQMYCMHHYHNTCVHCRVGHAPAEPTCACMFLRFKYPIKYPGFLK